MTSILAGRPGKLTTSKNMNMKMINRLTSFNTIVNHKPEVNKYSGTQKTVDLEDDTSWDSKCDFKELKNKLSK